jgi:hypothetical protein
MEIPIKFQSDPTNVLRDARQNKVADGHETDCREQDPQWQPGTPFQ